MTNSKYWLSKKNSPRKKRTPQYQPQYRSRSWLATLCIQRRDTSRLLKDNPSLKPDFDEALQEAYENARDLAMGET